MWSYVKFVPASINYWMWLTRPQVVEFEFKTAKGHSKSNIKPDKKLMNICKNPRIICSEDLLERNGGFSGRPEAARGFKSSFMNGFGRPSWASFLQTMAGLEVSRGRSRVLWNRSWMRIAWKVDFWRMSLTKSLLLEVHWSLKTILKPPITLAWSHKYSDFDLDNKN